MSRAAPLVLVLDGNSLLHRAYHAAGADGLIDRLGRPAWALRGLFGYVARAAAYLRPDAVIAGFDCPHESARKADYPGYKAQRPEKHPDLATQIALAPALLHAAGIRSIVPPAYEADDVLASSAEAARRAGWRSVLMTSDRDAFALIDDTTSVLRVRNGGFDNAVVVGAEDLHTLCGVHPWQYRDYAALRGDPSDNLHGVRQFGSATAARLLASFGTVDAAWAAMDAGETRAIRDAVGEHAAAQFGAPGVREIVERNRRLMRMRTDLPIPDLNAARLPLSLAIMRTALRKHDINLGPSLWALTGGAPPIDSPDAVPVLQRWAFRSGMTARRDPTPGQLALF